jgi:hypothetical protein
MSQASGLGGTHPSVLKSSLRGHHLGQNARRRELGHLDGLVAAPSCHDVRLSHARPAWISHTGVTRRPRRPRSMASPRSYAESIKCTPINRFRPIS